jgi:hypothetical protein
MFDIRLIGSLSGEPALSTESVAALLARERVPLRRGTAFMGRPGTALFCDGTLLAKLHEDWEWARPAMEKWAQKALERERAYAVHHPAKTWFLAERRADGRLFIGNACPLLEPLHLRLSEPPADAGERERRAAWLERLFRTYTALGRTHGVRLDEGLSNFGLDKAGALHYLDDEFYAWDDLASLAPMVGTWFRACAAFDAEFGGRLGGILRAVLAEAGFDAHALAMVASQARGLFMPQTEKRAALDAFAAALLRAGPAARPAPGHGGFGKARYCALVADVHANLPALRAVLDFLADHALIWIGWLGKENGGQKLTGRSALFGREAERE